MLITTGRKEQLTISKGSEIEVSSCEYDEYVTGTVWYRVILEENLAKSKRKKLSVRHLDPLLKEDFTPPLIQTTVHRLIRPLPPPDPFPDVDFEEGDVIDAAYRGGWWSGSVIKALGNRRFLVYLRFEPDVIEIDRNDLRPHFVWKGDEWFRCVKQQLIESDFSAGKSVEVRTKVAHLGDVWAPAVAIKENDDGKLLVKLKALSDCDKISLPYTKIRPSPPPCGLRDYKLMENVDALVESGWCPGVVTRVLSGKSYAVILGPNKESKEFSSLQLRPSIEWKDGVWHKEEKVSDSEVSSHAVEEETAASTRIRVTVRTALGEKTALATGRATRTSNAAMQNPPPTSSNDGDVKEAGRVSVTVTEVPHSETVALPRELGSNLADVVMNENNPVTIQPEKPATKEFYSSVVLGIAAATLTKPAVRTQGKTSPRKKLQAMKNQNSTNDSVGEKAPEEMKNKESVNKRKRGHPRKFISTEPKQKTGVAGNGSKAAAIELSDMTDDNRPLASWIHGGNSSSGQSVSPTPDPGLNSIVEKHVPVIETPLASESRIVLPFVKKSPLWKVLESMEVFEAVPQRPHFSPLLESEEEFREGDAIGTMVKFTALLEKVKNLQVDDPISSIKRIDECFLKLEKHGFDVTTPRSRISKLVSIKESQTSALEELKAVEEKITENDNKRRKCEQDIVELQRQEVLMKEAKVALDKEIALMQSHAEVLDQQIQNVDQEFWAIVTAPWK